MVKVQILSGSQAGQVVDQSLPEAESNIASGFAKRVEPPASDIVAPAAVGEVKPVVEKKTKKGKSKAK